MLCPGRARVLLLLMFVMLALFVARSGGNLSSLLKDPFDEVPAFQLAVKDTVESINPAHSKKCVQPVRRPFGFDSFFSIVSSFLIRFWGLNWVHNASCPLPLLLPSLCLLWYRLLGNR